MFFKIPASLAHKKKLGSAESEPSLHRLLQPLAPPTLHEALLRGQSGVMRALHAESTVCSSVMVVSHVTRSRRATSTLRCPASVSVHDIALQRTIGIGIFVVVTPTH
jgi:hypothetical protein